MKFLKNILTIAALVLMAAGLSSCYFRFSDKTKKLLKNELRYTLSDLDVKIDTVTYNVGQFNAVDIDMNMDDIVIVQTEGESKVDLMACDFLIDSILVTNEEGTLKVRLNDGTSRPQGRIKVQVYTPALCSISNNGCGDISISAYKGDSLSIKTSGSGDVIATNLEKKIKAELLRMLKDERESYETIYRSYGRQLKLCALDNYGARKEQLQDLLLFYSSTEKKPVTLAEYVSRMQPEQKFIYFASGDTVDAIDHMPQTELLKDHNMEILYFTDKADEFLPDMLQKYQDKPFRSAIDGDLELGDEQKPDETDSHQESFAFLKEALGDKVDQVKASTRLKTHPVCLSSGEGVTFEMEKYFRAAQPELELKAKRILELNVDHPAFAAFEKARLTDPERAKKYAQVFLHQAELIAGLPVDDPTAYTDLLCSLWQ